MGPEVDILSDLRQEVEDKKLKTPGDLPNPGIEPRSPALQGDSLPQGKGLFQNSPSQASAIREP